VASASGSVVVVPVNYAVDGDDVIAFRSDLGEKLGQLHERSASFQIDDIDPFHQTGWSVLVLGTAFRATAAEVEHLDVRPWAAGDKPYWVRVVPNEITGRRLVAPDLIEGVVS
jgi:nitroimidazol reductase NimA-like FMN-containing flavoprotein (pyridoxamine 5'-phosphate oxidase superfamily)